ncbi:MAG TPA: hypothetical protein VG265_08280 [Gaiellaceae bacterium]|jgi:hypothetical protein|nr:hypothetical protein [Gaiellaceae bacterium]
MKLNTILLPTVATLALATPAANAAGIGKAHHAKPDHHVTARTSAPATKSAAVSHAAVTPRSGPLFIHVQLSVHPEPYVGTCIDDGTGCTAYQFCEYWGMDCLPTPLPDPPATDTTDPARASN